MCSFFERLAQAQGDDLHMPPRGRLLRFALFYATFRHMQPNGCLVTDIKILVPA